MTDPILRRLSLAQPPRGASATIRGAALAAPSSHRLAIVVAAVLFTLAAVAPAIGAGPGGAALAALADDDSGHLLISEVMTGGTSASDEFVELYNPTAGPLPLEGLELIYVSASGATVTRRVVWPAGAPSVGPHGHHLLANDAGVFAGIGDDLYSGGMAASGGSVALRIQGASSAIDAVGWGTATAWLEGAPATAPAAGQSIERLPGGDRGSGTDTGDNFVDFVLRDVPDPQNRSSAAVPGASAAPSTTPTADVTATPVASASPTPDGTATPTAAATATPQPSESAQPTAEASLTPSASPTAEPSTSPVAVATARSQPDGSIVTVRGVALSASTFTDGGGFVADSTGGIAVLVADGAFERGREVTVTGEIDDRYSQRTIRASADRIGIGAATQDPDPVSSATGAVGEGHEGRLVRIAGSVAGPPSELASGLAFEVDDGSGPLRVLVAAGSDIDTAAWAAGARIDVVGIASQRDTSGSGTSGYRLLPRDTADVLSVAPPATPTPSASAEPTPPGEEPTPTPPEGGEEIPLVTIAQARAAESRADVRVRGVVTVPTGLIDGSTAIIQDGTAAIMLRLGGEAGQLRRGESLEVSGSRSTKSGMLTLRVNEPPRRLGSSAEPEPRRIATGAAGEALEAQLVVTRGAVLKAARKSSAGSVTFDIDDGSGPLRIHLLAALGADREGLTAGTWVEVTGALGQQTTGAQPERGYRIWPRSSAELRVLAGATGGGAGDDTSDEAGTSDSTADRTGAAGSGSLDQLLPGARDAGPKTVEATLVVGTWSELGVAGVLWDGRHAMGVAPDEAGRAAVATVLDRDGPPRSVRLTASRAASTTTALPLPVIELADERSLAVSRARPRDPLASLPSDGRVAWVRLTGRLERGAPGLALLVGDRRVMLNVLCRAAPQRNGLRSGELVEVQGLASGTRLIGVPCGGVRRPPTLVAAPGAALDRDASRAATRPDTPVDGVPPTLPLVLGASAVAGGGLLTAAAWRHGSFSRLLGSFVRPPASEEPQPHASGESDGQEPPTAGPQRPTDEPDGTAADDEPPRLTIVRAPPGSGL